MTHSTLLVEDDSEIGRLVSQQLGNAGYRCEWVQDGARAVQRFSEAQFDLILLDLMLPSLDGLEVCRRIRQRDTQTPLIMITARASTRDVVLGLEIGADDYITKPFEMQVLMARVQALMRRQNRGGEDDGDDSQPLIRGPLTIYLLKHLATLEGRPLELTAKEFALLTLFAGHPGRNFSRGELLDRVWGIEFEGYDHTVNTHINRLRNKIESDLAHPRFIRTVWGVGYRFADVDELNSQH